MNGMWDKMMGLFGYKTPQQLLKEHKRTLSRAVRELDRERLRMEQQEKKIILDIKKTAKAGQMNAVRVMAKDLVRTRRYVGKFYEMRTQLQGVSLRIQTLQSTQAMGDAMKGCVRAMHSLNRQLNLPQLQRIMADFEKQSYVMDTKEEIMGDALDEALDADEDEKESEAIIGQVLDEIGISIKQTMADAPATLQAASTPATKQQAIEEVDQVDLALEQRLRDLRQN